MKKLTPFGTRVIVKVHDKPEAKSTGGIIMAATSDKVEKSTLGTVMIPNHESYGRDNKSRQPILKSGDVVRFEKGDVGDELPEAPEGETWLAIPEECIIMKIEEV